MADEATKKNMSTKEKALGMTNTVTTNEDGRVLTKCIDWALHDCVEDIGAMDEATVWPTGLYECCIGWSTAIIHS